MDVHRQQHLYPDLVNAALKLRTAWKPDLIVIEKATTGLSLKPDLIRKGVMEAAWLSPEKGKVERMVAQSAKIEGGEARLEIEKVVKNVSNHLTAEKLSAFEIQLLCVLLPSVDAFRTQFRQTLGLSI